MSCLFAREFWYPLSLVYSLSYVCPCFRKLHKLKKQKPLIIRYYMIDIIGTCENTQRKEREIHCWNVWKGWRYFSKYKYVSNAFLLESDYLSTRACTLLLQLRARVLRLRRCICGKQGYILVTMCIYDLDYYFYDVTLHRIIGTRLHVHVRCVPQLSCFSSPTRDILYVQTARPYK